MRIAILGATNIKHMSLISMYTDIIDFEKNTVDMICIDKYGDREQINNIYSYVYPIEINRDTIKVKKLIKYLQFKNYAEDLIYRNDYDFIIVWGSYTAHLFKNTLLHSYKGRYTVNIRDYFYENNLVIKKRFRKIIEHSHFTSISSPEFLTFLPNLNKYRMVHSTNDYIIRKSIERNEYSKNKPLAISFIGNVRFFEKNKEMIDIFANDKNFVLQYFGTNTRFLKEYVEEKAIKNVIFEENFPINKTPDLLNKTDIINNVYGNDSVSLRSALSIRLYYSIYLNIPILTSERTFTSEKSKLIGLGFDLNLKDKDIKEKLLKWYYNLDSEKIRRRAEHEIQNIQKVNKEFSKEVEKLFN